MSPHMIGPLPFDQLRRCCLAIRFWMTASPVNNGFVQCPNGFAAPAWAFLAWPRRGLAKWIKNGTNGFASLHATSSDIRPPHRRPTGQSANVSLFDDACDLGADLHCLRLRTGLDSGFVAVHDPFNRDPH